MTSALEAAEVRTLAEQEGNIIQHVIVLAMMGLVAGLLSGGCLRVLKGACKEMGLRSRGPTSDWDGARETTGQTTITPHEAGGGYGAEQERWERVCFFNCQRIDGTMCGVTRTETIFPEDQAARCYITYDVSPRPHEPPAGGRFREIHWMFMPHIFFIGGCPVGAWILIHMHQVILLRGIGWWLFLIGFFVYSIFFGSLANSRRTLCGVRCDAGLRVTSVSSHASSGTP